MTEQAQRANQIEKSPIREFVYAVAIQMWFPVIMYFWITPALFPYQDPNSNISVEPLSWQSFILKTILGLCALGVFGMVLLMIKQESMLYVPKSPYQTPEENVENYNSPADRGLKFDDVFLTTKDGIKLHGWHMSLDFSQQKDTVVFMHENTGNLGMSLDYFETLVKKVQVNVLCVAYRGYSKSEGQASEQGLLIDAKAIANFISTSDKISDKKRVFLIGRSLGGAVALSLLSEGGQVFRAAIIENAWTSISEMVDIFYPVLKLFPIVKVFMLKMRWDNLQKIKTVTCPLMFVSGDRDTFVLTEMTQRLYDEYAGKKRDLYVVKGGNHNNTWVVGGEMYINKLRQFIAAHRQDSEVKVEKKVAPYKQRILEL
jgi:fermentation-respiration switch protein FrsA (DUF1100 family)